MQGRTDITLLDHKNINKNYETTRNQKKITKVQSLLPIIK